MIYKGLVCQLISFLNDLEIICLHICIAIVSMQLNGFYLTAILH